ncbi:hypothetical protein [Candidatus Entotheonella palauensis]|uniref:Uncharacterized protein n=1 Tax=Candidatus Entotheonella gemina TaxID=1429439 RepID=W4LQU6_9BACT|nr:hypothetical protein [Candidatus Entotheonella palauensis]ETX00111.1 MAG: hypothetical protein ETSY2_39675 [Candidatus Entotheonella gemina]
MKSYSIAPNLNVAGLKSLESSRPAHDFSALWKRFGQLFHISGLLERVANWLAGPVEPQIYKRLDRRGNAYYRLYDPKTDQSRFFSSEEDVRIWLDQRF